MGRASSRKGVTALLAERVVGEVALVDVSKKKVALVGKMTEWGGSSSGREWVKWSKLLDPSNKGGE